METKNLIQASATVIRIINLKKGDVFKSVNTSSYSDSEVRYNIVIDLLNDGENAYIETLEYIKSYDSVKAQVKLYDGKKDISIFPVQKGEVEEYLKEALKGMHDSIEKKKEELQKLIEVTEKAEQFVSGELKKQIREVEFKEMTQTAYNKQVQEVKIKKLQQQL